MPLDKRRFDRDDFDGKWQQCLGVQTTPLTQAEWRRCGRFRKTNRDWGERKRSWFPFRKHPRLWNTKIQPDEQSDPGFSDCEMRVLRLWETGREFWKFWRNETILHLSCRRRWYVRGIFCCMDLCNIIKSVYIYICIVGTHTTLLFHLLVLMRHCPVCG
jgi:hypothetical protein